LAQLLAQWAKRNSPVFKVRGSDREVHLQGDVDHGSSQAFSLTDGFLDSENTRVSVPPRLHIRFDSFIEQRILRVQVSRIASDERQSNGIPAWRSETRARIRERGSNVTDARE
jgi:hypothetical protein